jgi:hypothetical protein
VTIVEGTYLLKDEVNPSDKTITLIYGGSTLTEAQRRAISERAKDFSLYEAKLIFQQGFSLENLEKREAHVDGLKAEINRLKAMLAEEKKRREVEGRRAELGKQLLAEIKPIYPQIIACMYSEANTFRHGAEAPEMQDVIVFTIRKGSLKKVDRKKIENWLASRLENEKMKVFYET